MANVKILEKKQEIINEIGSKVKESATTVLFEYHGLTVSETMELRNLLKETGSEYKVYKNTLVKRALTDLNINMDEELNGPKAIAFGTDAIAPIKTLSDFAKKHPALVMKIGYVDGEVADIDTLTKLAALPSRDGLLAMIAGGLLQIPRDIAIAIDLHSKNLENN